MTREIGRLRAAFFSLLPQRPLGRPGQKLYRLAAGIWRRWTRWWNA